MEEYLLGFFEAYLQNISVSVFRGIPAVSQLHRGRVSGQSF